MLIKFTTSLLLKRISYFNLLLLGDIFLKGEWFEKRKGVWCTKCACSLFPIFFTYLTSSLKQILNLIFLTNSDLTKIIFDFNCFKKSFSWSRCFDNFDNFVINNSNRKKHVFSQVEGILAFRNFLSWNTSPKHLLSHCLPFKFQQLSFAEQLLLCNIFPVF